MTPASRLLSSCASHSTVQIVAFHPEQSRYPQADQVQPLRVWLLTDPRLRPIQPHTLKVRGEAVFLGLRVGHACTIFPGSRRFPEAVISAMAGFTNAPH